MRLKRIRIENFRGLSRLDLELDDVTVLIAENNHGKSSVFDVLGLCLGPRGTAPDTRFREADFYRDPGSGVDDIRVVLTFEDGSGDRHVEFTGSPDDRLLKRRFVDERGELLDPQPPADELERIRAQHPVLLLRFARPTRDPAAASGAGPGVRADRRGATDLSATVSGVYHDLARVRGPVSADKIAKGLEAAQRLLHERTTGDRSDVPMHHMLEELRGEVARWSRPRAADASLDLSGSGSHNLALLLVLGSLLDVKGADSIAAGAQPIIAIEEPEAHLHPILLASTWDVIEALRAQTLVTTNSGELLSTVPMAYLRRLVRRDEGIDVHRLGERTLSRKQLRRVAYHIRAKRGGVLFARCWMLVEGETEFWLMSQLASVLGYDLDAEGVRAIEFAQCGVPPLAKLANDLGIEWHLLADGDESGSFYARDAAEYLDDRPLSQRISKLGFRDVEQCLWHHGFDDVYREAARIAPRPDRGGPPPHRIIAKAVRKRSKPYLALAVADAAAERGRRSIPDVLRNVIETSVSLARSASVG